MTNITKLLNWLDTVRISVSDDDLYPDSKSVSLFAHSKDDETITIDLNIRQESRKPSKREEVLYDSKDRRVRREFDRWRRHSRGGPGD